MYSGSFVAMITPFDEANKIDTRKVEELAGFLIDSGSAGLVPCGTTGESATLFDEEKLLIVEAVVKRSKGRVPVIAGAGSNNTEQSIQLSKAMRKKGCDALLIVTPYYNKPSQEGLYKHYKAVASAVDIPVVIYNVPGRTASNILPQTVIRLMNDCKNIVSVKEASGSMDQSTEILAKARPGFTVLSGDDSLTLPLMSLGASGVISVVANIAPKQVSALCGAVVSGDWDKARQLHSKLFGLIKMCFIETNPVPVKTAAEMLGLCKANLRLPLCEMSDENKEKLKKAMVEFGLLPK